MASFNKFNAFVADVANKVHNLGADTLKIMLTNTAPAAGNAIKTDITEIAAGNGYAAGGSRRHRHVVGPIGRHLQAHRQQRDLHGLRRHDRDLPLRGHLQFDGGERQPDRLVGLRHRPSR